MSTNEILSYAEEYIIIAILAAALVLILHIFVSAKFGAIARDKGYKFGSNFVFCLIFGVIGWIAVWALPDKLSRKALEKIAKNLTPYEEPAEPMYEQTYNQQWQENQQ
ncbi:MAG: hypothetical protein MJ147_05850 [Clostridia bacterium]|nr:hypothetical protein [Clostridia bacterium]